MTFESLQLSPGLLKALVDEGYDKPTPIQEKAIPLVLEGKDVLGCAQTGTGKTAAFTLPMLQRLSTGNKPKGRLLRALIVTPTRELAIQIGDCITTYGRYERCSHAVIFGGVNQHGQVEALRKGVDILVATPGRLLDLMGQGYISLRDLQYFVLDEADRMLDMGFVHDVKRIIAALPPVRQSLFFSATMPPNIVKLAGSILKNPVQVHVTPVSSTVDTVAQSLMYVEKAEKCAMLIDTIQKKDVQSVLVFTRTKHGADKVSRMLAKSQISSDVIHGNKSQNARQRALCAFKDGKIKVLVATDIAARGIDVDNLECVINFEIPSVPETYVHRIGRTGRAGASGWALSFCDVEEKNYIRDIEKLIGKKIPVVKKAV